MQKYIFLILVLSNFYSLGQITYFNTFSNTRNDFCNYAIEDANNNILGVGSNSTVLSNLSTWQSLIWRISTNGDTLSRCYTFNDSSSQFNYIEQRGDLYYILATVFLPPNYNRSILQLVVLDTNLNIVNRSTIIEPASLFLIDNKVKKLSSEYFLLGDEDSDTCTYEVIIKLSTDFDSLGYYKIWPHLTALEDCLLSQDSTKFWLFTRNYNNVPGPEIVEFDLNFSSYTVRNFPYKHWPGTLDYEVYYDNDLTVEWYTDTTFLVGCNHRQTYDHMSTLEVNLGFSILDSTLSLSPIHYYGAADTMDFAAFITNFDFVSPDQIFFCGTKNISGSFFPTAPSWIIAGKLNSNLEEEYLKFYGGDAYYLTHLIIKTSDGGSLISGRRYDYNTQDHEWDVFFLKLNEEGIIVSNSWSELQIDNKVWLYPNPVSTILKIETTMHNGRFNIYSSEGSMIRSALFSSSRFNINVENLKAGFYLIEFEDNLGFKTLTKFKKK